uniref:Chromosome 17 open reading frame 108 n=1 Tax=Pan troglodytes TaxID=9598 RepID=K7B965_PANTR
MNQGETPKQLPWTLACPSLGAPAISFHWHFPALLPSWKNGREGEKVGGLRENGQSGQKMQREAPLGSEYSPRALSHRDELVFVCILAVM